MKKLTTLLAVMALSVVMASCGKSYDPAKVKVGMTEAEIVDAVGKPDGQTSLMGRTYYTYGENTVVFEDGVVVDDNLDSMEDALNELNELGDELQDLGSALEGLTQ